jgi:hypothetical protein
MNKALTKWFQTHPSSVIAPHQTCSILDRSINDNLLLVKDLILHLLSLDQENAFDRYSYGFLQRVLTRLTFPNTSSTGPNTATEISQAEFC